MAVRTPIVRHLIACEQVNVSPADRRVTLQNVFYAIRGASFPRTCPQIDLFVQVTDGSGKYTFTVQLVFIRSPSDEIPVPLPDQSFILDLGPDPLAVRGFVRRLKNVKFDQPGDYEFRLLCDGQVLAREPILVRV
jgi:hypothetical protein